MKRSGGPPLPPGSSLTVIFDSPNSGTLLGNASFRHVRRPLLLTPRKTSTIISATTYIARGSTREKVGVEPSEITSVSRHCTFITCNCSSFHAFVQLGGTLLLGPRANTVPQAGTRTTTKPSASLVFSSLYARWRCQNLTSTTRKGVRPRTASLHATGGAT